MNTSLLYEELAPLNEQIEGTEQRLRALEAELRSIDAELETHLAEKERFEALREVCNALDRLDELDAGDLFWSELTGVADTGESLDLLRNRIASFETQAQGIEGHREAIKTRIAECLYDLDDLDEEVRQVHAREERRQEEFVVEREMGPIPFLPMAMPWNIQVESERRFRKTLLVCLFWGVTLGTIIPLVALPIIDRSVEVVKIPQRLVTLVKNEPLIPEPVQPKPHKELEQKKRAEPEKPKQEVSEKTAKTEQKKPAKVAPAKKAGGAQVARKKAETTGVLAFKSTFSDLMDEVPVAKLGTDARVNKDSKLIPGQSQAQRNLVAMQAKSGTSGGISSLGVSRNLGNGGSGGGGSGYGNAGQIGGIGYSDVESSLTGIGGDADRPMSGGPGPGRTDEEIQIVFDRYKATLYRIYNKELRKDPTLRGKLLLKITIEPEGEVSMCLVESTDLASDYLVTQIVDRVRKFNFGPKEEVPVTTILYPIDFLPAT